MELSIKWKNFKAAIESYIAEANDLLYTERAFLNPNDCEYLEKKVNNWIKVCEKYLAESFNIVNNEFIIGFRAAKPYSSFLNSASSNKCSEVNNLLDELNTKKKTLRYYLELLSISDVVIQPKLIDKEIRASYTRREIVDLIMDKLYHLYNHNYYSIMHILRGNGITTDKDTTDEIVKLLEKKGYIRTINNRGIMIQLSSKGKKYIDDKRNFDLITRYISPLGEIEKIEVVPEMQDQNIQKETVYHYYERQYVY